MTFREEETEAGDLEEPPKKKKKGVFFKDIYMRTLLRKPRAKVSASEFSELNDSVEVRPRREMMNGEGRGLAIGYWIRRNWPKETPQNHFSSMGQSTASGFTWRGECGRGSRGSN